MVGWTASLRSGRSHLGIFTPLTTPGVQSPSWNAISWGVEIVGEYEEEEFTETVKSNVAEALATLHGKLVPTFPGK